MDYDDLSKGVSLRHREPERKRVAEKYGTTKPRYAKRSTKGAGVKDCRPPDTTKAHYKKNPLSEARALIRHYVIDEGWDDYEFGSLTLWFYNVTGDVDSYNSSEHLNFPLNLNYNNDGIGSIRYNLTARAFSTTSSGTHFYAKIIHNNVVYRYYDLKSQGVVSIESKDPNSLSGKHSNSVLVAYDLCEEEASTRFSNNCIEIFLEKLSNFEIEIPKEKSTSAIYCDAKVIENKERIVRRSKRIKTENKS
ncbi:8924_t:CDS:2 [Entrophospora sp. SA101]|nr:8924_t:CDS:2 [Entrophospora sp. SA101]